jgi:hypothetical protein
LTVDLLTFGFHSFSMFGGSSQMVIRNLYYMAYVGDWVQGLSGLLLFCVTEVSVIFDYRCIVVAYLGSRFLY